MKKITNYNILNDYNFKEYVPILLSLGIVGFAIYAHTTKTSNARLADGKSNEWKLNRKQEADIAEIKSKIEIEKSIKERRKLIAAFYKIIRNGDTINVLNKATGVRIWITSTSQNETKKHAAKSVKSSKTVLYLKEILENAQPFEDTIEKTKNNKGQSRYSGVKIFYYDLKGIGLIKIVVGIRYDDNKHEQYCVTAIE